MLKKDFLKSVFLSFSFASLVFAFQNCSNPFRNQDAFISNVNPQTAKTSSQIQTGSAKTDIKSTQ